MYILRRLTAGFLLAIISSNAFSLTVNDYTATTRQDEQRIVPLQELIETGAVTFDSSLQENPSEASVGVFCGNRVGCIQGDTGITLEGIGAVTVSTTNNIIITPEAGFFGEASFFYEVAIFNQDTAPVSATFTIVVTRDVSNITNTNYQKINTILGGYCDPDSSAFNSLSNDFRAACDVYNNASGVDLVNIIESISPEEVVAEFTSTTNMTKDQTGNLTSRLNALRGGAAGFSLSGLNYISGDDVFYGQWIHEMANQLGGNSGGEENFSRLGFFINGSITDGEKDTSSLEQGYDMDGDSITLGADYRISNTLVAGIAFGMSETDISFSSSNEMNNETDNLLVYGSWYKDQFYIDGMIGYASGEIETKRRIIIGSINEVVGGNTESSQMFFSVTGNYDFINGALTYGPFASLDYIDGEIDGYEEIGGTGFEVGFADQDIKSQVLTFGGRVQYAWSQSWGIIVPHARAEWKTELEKDRDAIIGRFVLDQSANEFAIEADDLDSDWFQLALGISATFQRGLSAYIDYEEAVSYDDISVSTLSFGGRWEAKF